MISRYMMDLFDQIRGINPIQRGIRRMLRETGYSTIESGKGWAIIWIPYNNIHYQLIILATTNGCKISASSRFNFDLGCIPAGVAEDMANRNSKRDKCRWEMFDADSSVRPQIFCTCDISDMNGQSFEKMANNLLQEIDLFDEELRRIGLLQE